jgi:hypothetical protein
MELGQPVASGRSIDSAIQVVEPRFEWTPADIWRWVTSRPITAEVTDGSRHLAALTSGFAKTREISGIVKVRRTIVELPSGARWTIDTEPDWPTAKKGRARAAVVVARDDLGRVLTIVQSPGDQEVREARHERKRLLRDQGGTASDRVTRTARAVGGSVRSELGRDHRRGLLRWLILGVLLLMAAFGFAMGGLTSASTLGPTATTIFLVVAVVLGTVGWLSLRRWRDRSHCWSCGFPTEGGPEVCLSCSAPRPASGGLVPRLRGFGGEATTSIARTTPVPVHLEVNAVTVRSGDGSSWAAPRDGGWVVEDSLVVHRKVQGTATIVPEGEVPLEVALAMWHMSVGDVVRPSSP